MSILRDAAAMVEEAGQRRGRTTSDYWPSAASTLSTLRPPFPSHCRLSSHASLCLAVAAESAAVERTAVSARRCAEPGETHCLPPRSAQWLHDTQSAGVTCRRPRSLAAMVLPRDATRAPQLQSIA